MPTRKLRVFYAILFLVLLLAEVFIALFVHDSFIRPYFGDVLVTVLICAFCRIWIPKRVGFLPAYVFAFAVAVELSQHFQLVRLFGLDHIPFFAILLGTTYSHYDLICYAAGCMIFAAVQWYVKGRCE